MSLKYTYHQNVIEYMFAVKRYDFIMEWQLLRQQENPNISAKTLRPLSHWYVWNHIEDRNVNVPTLKEVITRIIKTIILLNLLMSRIAWGAGWTSRTALYAESTSHYTGLVTNVVKNILC